jgi:hypothetical protein
MQPLYSEDEFKAAKSRQLLPLHCLHCKQTFHKTKSQIQADIIHSKGRTGDFCSRSCKNKNYRNGHLCTVVCKLCQTTFTKELNQVRKTKNHFCSHSCAAKYNNAHKTKGTRISKLEVWISKQLPKLYPDLDFHFNRKDAINGELDIYIPSLRLDFELNGIFHYEPIYGADKLASIKTNDSRKSQACFEHNIELCLIDVSTFKNFKEQKAMRFLTIVTNLINSKLES